MGITENDTASRSQRSSNYIVAAVHSRSRHFDAVVRRTRELSEASGSQVVFLTVATRRPLSTEFDQTRRRLAQHPMIVHMVGSWVDGDLLSPEQLNESIAEELVRGADELRAGTLILGLDPAVELVPSSVLALVAKSLPADVDLRFGGADLSQHLALARQPVALASGG